jgi:hypothetical protein
MADFLMERSQSMSDDKQTEIDQRQEIKIEDLPVDDERQDNVKGGPTQMSWLPAK